MNPNLFKRTLKKQLPGLAVYAASLFFFQLLMVVLYPGMKDSMAMMLEDMPSIFLSFMGGADILYHTLTGFITIGLTHPLVILILAAYPLNLAGKAISGELVKGTGELLFTRPIKRYRIILTHLVVALFGIFILSLGILLGLEAGFWAIDITERIPFQDLLPVTINIAALMMATAGLGFFISAAVPKAELTPALAAGAIALMYVLDFLTDIWEGLEVINTFSLYNYYHPGEVIAGNGYWLSDTLLLLIAGLILTGAAMVILEKRDL